MCMPGLSNGNVFFVHCPCCAVFVVTVWCRNGGESAKNAEVSNEEQPCAE